MRRRPVLVAAVLLAGAAACSGAPSPAAPLALERSYEMPGVGGRLDHLAFDPARRRIFVAALGAGAVEAVDLDSGRVARADGLPEPQGIVFLPKQDAIAVACGGDGSLRFLDAATLRPLAALALGADADNVHLDPASGRILVGYGSGGLAIVDPERRSVVQRIALPAHPEGFAVGRGGRVFVNLPDAHAIAVVGLGEGRIVATWPAAHRANFPLAVSDSGGLVATVFRAPSRLVLLDAASGAVRQDLPACGDADDLFFDESNGRIYVSCGAGRIDVYARRGGAYAPAGEVATRSGARTSLLIPALDRLAVAARAGFPGGKAELLVYRPTP